MKKEELKKSIDALSLPRDEFYILSGGALLLYGFREETDDLDLCVSKELFDLLCKTHNITIEEKENICPIYLIDGQIECIVRDKKEFDCNEVEGYLVSSLTSILEFKKQRNLPKDAPDIAAIEAYLKEMNAKKPVR